MIEKGEYVEWLCERIIANYEDVLNVYVTDVELRNKLLDSLKEIVEFICDDFIEVITC